LLDDIVTDNAGNRQAFALSMRISAAQVGMVVAIIFSPMIFNVRHNLLDCAIFMLCFIAVGFVACIIIAYQDSEDNSSVK
jgi:small-conductance mechanosensitive channel